MRIKGYLDDPVMKITILEMNNRISVKFEWNLLEQTYKLTDDLSLAAIGNAIDHSFRKKVMEIFKEMHDHRNNIADSDLKESPFPEII